METEVPRKPIPTTHFELLLVIAVLSAGLFALFWEVFVLGYVQVPADIIFTDPAIREAAPPGFVRPQNGLLGDQVNHFFLWHYVAAGVMQRDGEIPLWNPYTLAGTPLVANAQSTLFYPPNLLLFRLAPAEVATLRAFFNILVAGIFTFLFCRSLRISLPGAVLSAVSYAFSGAIMVGLGYPMTNVLVWLPLCLWAVENLLTGVRSYFWGLVASIGVGLSLVGGHPETTFHVLMSVGLYAGARLVLNTAPVKIRVRWGIILLAAVLLGFLLGAIQWLPFVDFLSNSDTVSRSRSWLSQGTYFYTKEWLPNVTTLITLVFPNFFGNPENLSYFWPFSNLQNYLEQSMYFGLIPLALALGAIVTARKKNVAVLILAILALLFLAVALRLPGFEALNYLPVFHQVNNTRLKWIFSFLGAVLAGFGLDGLRDYLVSRKKGFSLFVWAAGLPVLAAIAIFILALMAKIGLALRWISVDGTTRKLLTDIFSLGEAKTMVSVAVAVLAVVCFVVLRRRPQWLKAGEWIVVAATLAELIVVARGFNTTMPPQYIYPPVRLTQELQKDTSRYRVLAVPPILWANYGAAYGIDSVSGFDLPEFSWSSDLRRAQGRGTGYRQAWGADWPLVNWMNVKYVISSNEQNLPNLKLAFAGDGYYVYRNEDVLPRAYLTYQAQVIADKATALQKLVSGSFDFKNEVLLESDLPADQAALFARSAGLTPSQQVDFVTYENDAVTLDVSTSAPGLLVTSDIYDPGWEVRVDGVASPLYRANWASRAVFIPAGEHHLVQFTYRPWSFTWGSRLTMAGMLILAIGIPLSLVVRRAKSGNIMSGVFKP